MKLSILTTITDPELRQDPYKEAIESYCDLADEVVVVDGSHDCRIKPVDHKKIKVVCNLWPKEWSWKQLPIQLNKGLEQCTGDWVLKLDIDQMIHEKDNSRLRMMLTHLREDVPVITCQKYSVYPSKRYTQKGEMILGINLKTYRDKIKYGRDLDKESDLCTPIWVKQEGKVPLGTLVTNGEGFKSTIPYWNFDYTFKSKEVARNEFLRFSKAYHAYFGSWQWGRTADESLDVFLNMMEGRWKSAPYHIDDIKILPKYIHKKYLELTPDQFGYDGWGVFK